MNTRIKIALAGAIAVAGLGFDIAGPRAMPINGLAPAVATQADIGAQIDNVRWVGGPRGGFRGRRGGRYFRGGRWWYYGGCSYPAWVAGLCY